MGVSAQPGLPWTDAPILLALSRSKSFMAAAGALGIDRTTVARRLDRLEATLGIKLFERSAAGLDLTPEGRRILSFVERAEQELSQLHPDEERHRIGYGKVRLSLSQHVLAAFAAPLARFIDEHPDFFLDLATSDRYVDLHRFEADIVLRLGKSRPSGLHSIDLGPVHFGLYRRADEDGPISRVWALPGQTSAPVPTLGQSEPVEVIAAVDGVLPTRDMILAGGGAGVLPHFLGENDLRLSPSPSDVVPEPYRLWMSCLPEQRNLVRIRSVMKGLAAPLSDALTRVADTV